MRLILDEMLAPAIAQQLRARGHDVVAVEERGDLRGLSDPEQFERAQHDGRVIVTYNRDDYLALDLQYRAAGRRHAGLVIINSHRFPQLRGRYGPLIASLDAFVRADEQYPSFVAWLQ